MVLALLGSVPPLSWVQLPHSVGSPLSKLFCVKVYMKALLLQNKDKNLTWELRYNHNTLSRSSNFNPETICYKLSNIKTVTVILHLFQVRFLEAQNRKLAADLDALRSRWGKDTSSIRAMYEGELIVSNSFYIFCDWCLYVRDCQWERCRCHLRGFCDMWGTSIFFKLAIL